MTIKSESGINFSLEELKNIIDSMNVAVFVLDCKSGEMLLANDRLSADIKNSKNHIIGNHFHDVFWTDFNRFIEMLLLETKNNSFYTEIYYWADRNLWGQVSANQMTIRDDLTVMLVTITNISELGKSEYEYKRLAYFDSLLGLPNAKQLELDIATLPSYEDTALIHFDIKQLSMINDLYGWDTGDYLLEQISEWLSSITPPTGHVYRSNDDEFCLLIQRVTLEQAADRANEIIDRFNKPWKQLKEKNNMPLYCWIITEVIYGEPLSHGIRDVLSRSINELKSTKDFLIYDSKMDKMVRDKLLMRQTLVNCLQEDMQGFEVYYQPVVEAKTGQWVGAEALCRWTMPGVGPIAPLVFISEAEDIGLIEEIDTWVLRNAMKNCVEIGLAGKDFFLDVNVSPRRNIDELFLNRLIGYIDNCKFPNSQLNLEITESGKFDFSNDNIESWKKLLEAGITISLDDFGTGYSSFNNLANIPADILKIEKAFLNNIENDEYLQFLLRQMVNLAHTLDMKIITEGVENEQQAKLLKEYGVDFFQGYLFSKPMSYEDFKKKVEYYK